MFTLTHNDRKQLVLITRNGDQFVDVEPVRSFPLSDPRHSVSIVDNKGREIFFVESLDDMSPETRAMLEAELSVREFIPTIVRIINEPGNAEPATWQVETDRGITTFEVESEDSIHKRDTHRVSIVDSHGIRYEIPDTRKLDHHSRRALDRYL